MNLEDTLFFKILKIEKNILGNKKYYREGENNIRQILLSIINKIKIKKILEIKNEKEKIILILENIHKELKSLITIDTFNFSYFSLDSKKKTAVCRDLVFYYISIFQLLGFNLKNISGVLAPNHIFIRYKFNDGTYINWETMFESWKLKKKFKSKTPILSDDEYICGAPYYIESDKITKHGLEYSYLKPLSELELICVAYTTLGSALTKFNEIQKAYDCFEYVYSNFRNFPDNLINLITILLTEKDFKGSKTLSKLIINLVGNEPRSYLYYAISLINIENSNVNEIIQSLDTSIKINSNDSNTYFEGIKILNRIRPIQKEKIREFANKYFQIINKKKLGYEFEVNLINKILSELKS